VEPESEHSEATELMDASRSWRGSGPKVRLVEGESRTLTASIKQDRLSNITRCSGVLTKMRRAQPPTSDLAIYAPQLK
jgi:hypothetical protein